MTQEQAIAKLREAFASDSIKVLSLEEWQDRQTRQPRFGFRVRIADEIFFLLPPRSTGRELDIGLRPRKEES